MSQDSRRQAVAQPAEEGTLSSAVGPATTKATGVSPSARIRPDQPTRPDLARLAPVVSGGLALALGAWQVSRLSFTQDEAATMSAVRRPLGSMLAMLGRIDAVHGAYYFVLHVVLKLGQSAAFVRAPSVLAIAGAAALVALIGAKLEQRWVGLAVAAVAAVVAPVAWLASGQSTRSAGISARMRPWPGASQWLWGSPQPCRSRSPGAAEQRDPADDDGEHQVGLAVFGSSPLVRLSAPWLSCR